MNPDIYYILAFLSLPAVLSVGASLCWPGSVRLVGLSRLGLHAGVIAAAVLLRDSRTLFLPLVVATLALPAAAAPHHLAVAVVARTRTTTFTALLGILAGTCSLVGVGSLVVAVNLVESLIGGGNDASAPWMITAAVAYGLGLLVETATATVLGLRGIILRLRPPRTIPEDLWED